MRFIPAVSPVQIQVPLPNKRRTAVRFYIKRPGGQAVKTPPFHGGNTGSSPVRVTTLFIAVSIWRHSSAGRASASHAEGHRFEFCRLHHEKAHPKGCAFLFCKSQDSKIRARRICGAPSIYPSVWSVALDRSMGWSHRLSTSMPLPENTVPSKSRVMSVGTFSSSTAVPLLVKVLL